MSRRQALTQEVHDMIVEGIRTGMPECWAARRAGITDRTLRQWRTDVRRGKNGKHAALVAAIENARGEFIHANLKVIEKAAKRGVWQAAAWKLERTLPEQFGLQRAELAALRAEVSRLLKLVGDKPRPPHDPPPEAPAEAPAGEPVDRAPQEPIDPPPDPVQP